MDYLVHIINKLFGGIDMPESKSKKWFKDNVSENEAELITIGGMADEMLHKTISLGLTEPMTTITLYASIFETLCDVVVDREKEYDDFNLNVADRMEIGYSTTANDDDEKTGNYMVYIRHLESKASDTSLDEDEDDTIELCTQWNAANIRVQADIIKEAAARAMKDLSDIINIKVQSSEFVIPMFCIIHSQILRFIRTRREETKRTEYELNVAGLFTIGVQITEDGDEEIYYVPSIALKLKFKNDAIASGRDE